MNITLWGEGRRSRPAAVPQVNEVLGNGPVRALGRMPDAGNWPNQSSAKVRGGFLLATSPELHGYRVSEFLDNVTCKADRARHHSDRACRLPGNPNLARDGADGACGIDRQRPR